MFATDAWFAWYPVRASNLGKPEWVWLTTVVRDRTFDRDGVVANTRYYIR